MAYPASPTREVRLPDFTDANQGNAYGGTVRAWLIAPVNVPIAFGNLTPTYNGSPQTVLATPSQLEKFVRDLGGV